MSDSPREPAGPVVGGIALTLDCLGMKCPRPIIELARHIAEVPVGDAVEIFADDPAAAPDVAAWCRMRGHQLITSEATRWVIRRAA